MTQPEHEEPVVRDKRRLDPTTGELREQGGAAVEPDGGAAAAPDPTTAGGEAGGATGGTPSDALEAAKAEAADLFDQLQRAKADLYNLDQRFNNYVKRSRTDLLAEKQRGVESVVEALIPVLDDIEAARQHGGLEGPLGAIAEKFESTLSGRFEVQRFGAVGDEFDPNHHEALMHDQSADVSVDTVTTVLQPGYQVGERVVRPARVAVTGPE